MLNDPIPFCRSLQLHPLMVDFAIKTPRFTGVQASHVYPRGGKVVAISTEAEYHNEHLPG